MNRQTVIDICVVCGQRDLPKNNTISGLELKSHKCHTFIFVFCIVILFINQYAERNVS